MSARDQIKAVLALAGPDKVTLPVTYDGVTEDYTFRVLSVIDLDKLRAGSIGAKGTFDPNRAAGNNARWVAACLLDENGNKLADYQDIIGTPGTDAKGWPPYFVDALGAAARKANKADVTVEEQEKN